MSPDSHQHGGSFAFSARAQAPHDHFCRVGKHSRRTQCRAQVREQVPDAGVQRPFLAQTYRSRHVAGQKRIQLRRDPAGLRRFRVRAGSAGRGQRRSGLS